MSLALAEMTPGFRDAVHGAQQVFRTLLEAMSLPGRVMLLPAAATDGVVPPAGVRALSVGTACVLLTLLDAETSVRLAGEVASADAQSYLRFHTGVRAARADESAAFTVAHAADVEEALCRRLDLGSDEMPQRGATLVVDVDGLGDAQDGIALQLDGPGIPSRQRLSVRGLSREFWQWRAGLPGLMPRGFELILVDGVRIAAIPRSTRITLEH